MFEKEYLPEVERIVRDWVELRQGKSSESLKVSEGAVEFLAMLIEFIEKDPSPAWDRRFKKISDFPSDTRLALSMLPKALDNLTDRWPKYKYRNEISELTSWEIWHELSRILDKMCFIPKK
jgi:hypothetical protein